MKHESAVGALPSVLGQLSYLAPGIDRAEVRVFPPSSGLAAERPASTPRSVPIHDARPIATDLRLDEHGFELHSRRSAFADFYDEAAVRERYYPEVRTIVRDLIGAFEVVVFDHNVRSAVRAARGELGV